MSNSHGSYRLVKIMLCCGLLVFMSVCVLQTQSFGAVAQVDRVPDAGALFTKALNLEQEGDLRGARAVYDEIAISFGNAADPGLRIMSASAFFFKAHSLEREGDFMGAYAVYDEAVNRFGNDPVPEVRQQAAAALITKGMTLFGQGYFSSARDAYKEALLGFGDDMAPPVRKLVEGEIRRLQKADQ
ncbi:MAG: hypothetical protein LBP68_07010 [Acidobacteriota bacterium]|nr:hypothetical protein [Acidobacteriota bacterium]